MKTLALALLVACSAAAANLRWTATFTEGWTENGITADTDPVGVMTAEEVAGNVTVSLELAPAYLPQPFQSRYGTIWNAAEFLYMTVGFQYDVDQSWISEGSEAWLKPYWNVNNITYQLWFVAEWSAPEEWDFPVIPPDPEDPPGGGEDPGEPPGEPGVPEPSTYALLFALGLAGWGATRKLR